MNPLDDETRWEEEVSRMGRHMPFPPTPDIAGSVRSRLTHSSHHSPLYLKAAAVVLVLALIVLLSIPDIRTAALEFFRIGAITITDQTPPPTPSTVFVRGPNRIESLSELPNEITLPEAQAQMDFGLPAALGEPDRVFMPFDDLIVLVWTEPKLVSLEIINARVAGTKYLVDDFQELSIHQHPAIWIDQPHETTFYSSSGASLSRLVERPVLIWDIPRQRTYRLEGDLSLEEARQIAESVP
jgi:hypothetical protein